MKIYISSFIVVTDKAIDFINTCKNKGDDYLLVMTDGGNPIIGSDVREDWLVNSSGYKELPIESILHNEDDDDFTKAVNELLKKFKGKDVIYESFYDEEDANDILSKLNGNLTLENDLRGDLHIFHKDYLDSANKKWKARYGNRFVEIITSTQFSKESEDFGFILVTDTVAVDSSEVVSTETYISLAKDYDRKSFFAPTTNVESFDSVPLFISIMEDNFGITINDYHFRTFVENGKSERIVFLMTDNDEDTLEVLFGDVEFEVNKYSDLVSIPKSQAYIAGGIGSWASLMVDDIAKEEEVSEE